MHPQALLPLPSWVRPLLSSGQPTESNLLTHQPHGVGIVSGSRAEAPGRRHGPGLKG